MAYSLSVETRYFESFHYFKDITSLRFALQQRTAQTLALMDHHILIIHVICYRVSVSYPAALSFWA